MYLKYLLKKGAYIQKRPLWTRVYTLQPLCSRSGLSNRLLCLGDLDKYASERTCGGSSVRDDFDTAQHRRARPQDRRAQTRANAIPARLMAGVAPGPTLDSDILTSVLSEVSRVPANFEPIQWIPALREAISTRIRRRTKINTGKEGRLSLNPVCEGTSADLTGATRQMGHHCKATG